MCGCAAREIDVRGDARRGGFGVWLRLGCGGLEARVGRRSGAGESVTGSYGWLTYGVKCCGFREKTGRGKRRASGLAERASEAAAGLGARDDVGRACVRSTVSVCVCVRARVPGGGTLR